MDAVQLVKKDHDHVEELFVRFKGGSGLTGVVRRMTGSVPARQRRTALEGICRELDVHARIEEEILYPAAKATNDPELDRLVDESLREHAGVKEHVAWLRQHPDDEGVDERMSALEQEVQHHVSEEEHEMLPKVEEMIPARERTALGRRMQARKQALLGRPRKPAARRTTASRKRRAAVAAPRRARKPAKVRRTRAKTRKRAS